MNWDRQLDIDQEKEYEVRYGHDDIDDYISQLDELITLADDLRNQSDLNVVHGQAYCSIVDGIECLRGAKEYFEDLKEIMEDGGY